MTTDPGDVLKPRGMVWERFETPFSRPSDKPTCKTLIRTDITTFIYIDSVHERTALQYLTGFAYEIASFDMLCLEMYKTVPLTSVKYSLSLSLCRPLSVNFPLNTLPFSTPNRICSLYPQIREQVPSIVYSDLTLFSKVSLHSRQL